MQFKQIDSQRKQILFQRMLQISGVQRMEQNKREISTANDCAMVGEMQHYISRAKAQATLSDEATLPTHQLNLEIHATPCNY